MVVWSRFLPLDVRSAIDIRSEWYGLVRQKCRSDGGVCIRIVANVDLNVFGFIVLLGF